MSILSPVRRFTSTERSYLSIALLLLLTAFGGTAWAQVESKGLGDPSRVVITPTAFVRPSDEVAINFLQLGSFTLDYGASDRLTVGFRTAIPAGVIPISGFARFAQAFRGGSVGAHLEAGFVRSFAFNSNETVFGLVGGPMLTLGTPEHYLNFGLNGAVASIPTETDRFGAMLAPTIGGSTRLCSSVRLNLELHGARLFSGGDWQWAKGALVIGTVRIFGGRFWGDVGLIHPLFSGFDAFETIPIGIPFLSFGMTL